MKQYITIIKQIERELTLKYGRLNLFGLFEREDLKNKWDVIISVNIPLDTKNVFLNEVITKFRMKLKPSAIIQISRFIYLEPNHEFVLNINGATQIENSDVEISNSTFINVHIRHAIVLSSFRYQSAG
jgi:hypothetical protein